MNLASLIVENNGRPDLISLFDGHSSRLRYGTKGDHALRVFYHARRRCTHAIRPTAGGGRRWSRREPHARQRPRFQLVAPEAGWRENGPPVKTNLGLLADGGEHEGLELVSPVTEPD